MRSLVLVYTGLICHKAVFFWKAMRSLVLVYTGPIYTVFYLKSDVQANVGFTLVPHVIRQFSI